MMYSLVFFFIVAVYVFFIVWLALGIRKVSHFTTQFQSPITTFSIIVPFRNEAKMLPDLLESISQLQYPQDLFEVILVDDDSTDDFQMNKFAFNCALIPNVRKSNAPKKDAIETGVAHAKNTWILTTDADCLVPSKWLTTLDAFIRTSQVELVVGPVSYLTDAHFLQHFQQLELMSLQGATMGSFGINQPFMCNGANFAYTKKRFQALDGFSGTNHISSGDDVFLLQKALKHPDCGVAKIGYLKSHDFLVLTHPCNSWSGLVQQRIRWASKTAAYTSAFAKALALAVFLGNFSLVVVLVTAVFNLIPFWDCYLLFAVKICADFFLQYQTGNFIQPRQIRYYLLSTLVYPFFSTGVALWSIKGKYVWKGR